MHFSPDKPFNQLPDLPPKTELETPRVLKATTRASRALAELKGRTETPGCLMLDPFGMSKKIVSALV